LHALGFEGGLVLILLPLVAYWLGISLWAALVTNLALFVFFFVCLCLPVGLRQSVRCACIGTGSPKGC
jgi:uncharacterized membrane protein